LGGHGEEAMKQTKNNAALCCDGMGEIALLLPVMDKAAPF
jgi:hypothetical protein